MNRVEIESFRTQLRLSIEAEQDYNAVFGEGSYWRMISAKQAGCVIVKNEKEIEL